MKLRIFVDVSAPQDAFELLKEGTRGHELMFAKAPASSVLAQSAWDPRFAMADVAFGQPDVAAIERASALKWLHVSTSGITRYDNAAFRSRMAERSIPVSNSASVYNEYCAVHALSFMLAQARSLPTALQTRTANGTAEWHALRSSCLPLRGQTVLIVGYGAIGRRLAELLAPFEMNAVAYRRHCRGDENVRVVGAEELPGELSHADHVVNILPFSNETVRFFDASRFAAMKRGAIFYNIGRGVTVDQQALLDALRSGHVEAAWLDVTEPEPLPDDHPLWSEPNCFITPHIAGGHKREAITLVQHFLTNLRRFTHGEPLLDRVM